MRIEDILGQDLNSLSDDQKKAAIEAVKAILQSREGGGDDGDGPMPPPPPKIDVDPDLLQPPPPPGGKPKDIDFDDPDKVLDRQKQMPPSGQKASVDSRPTARNAADKDNQKVSQDSSQSDPNKEGNNGKDGNGGTEGKDGHDGENGKDGNGDNGTEGPSGDNKTDHDGASGNDKGKNGNGGIKDPGGDNKKGNDGTDGGTNDHGGTDGQGHTHGENGGDSEEGHGGENPGEDEGKEGHGSDGGDDNGGGIGGEDEGGARTDPKGKSNHKFDPDKLDPGQILSSIGKTPEKVFESKLNNILRTIDLGEQAIEKAKKTGAPIAELEKALDKLRQLSKEDIEKLSGDELGDLINDVLDAIDRIIPVQYSTDIEARIQKIKDDTEASAKEIDQEVQTNKRSEKIIKELEKQKIKAREDEKNRFASASLKPLSRFYIDFSRAIEDQVEDFKDETEEDSWSALSRRHDGSDGIVAPGKVSREVWGKDIPVVDIYMDCSGSWGVQDTEIGTKAVKSIQEFEDKGEIKINLFYFANHVYPDYASAAAEGGTHAWFDILDNIEATRAKNVVLITDSDMEYLGATSPRQVVVEGHVWLIWKHGERAPSIPTRLRGRAGVSQYQF